MPLEDTYTSEELPTSATWQQYYPSPQDVPYGFQFNENQAMANALRGYNQDPFARPVTYMPGYEDTLTRKLLEKNNANLTTTQPRQSGGGMQMPNMNMNMLSGVNSKSFGVDTTLPATSSATKFSDGNAAFGSTGGAEVTGDSFVGSQLDSPDFTPSAGGMYDGGGSTQWFGNGGELGGGWLSAAAGGLAGYNQGRENYKNDPNMWNQKDGFGTQHKDYRAEVGGGTLGGVMGYWGGPVGAALAGPTVKAVHPFAEKTTRGLINFGDKWGGATGASIMDPVGTMSSGKYKWGEIFQVPFTKKLFGW